MQNNEVASGEWREEEKDGIVDCRVQLKGLTRVAMYVRPVLGNTLF